MSMACTGRDAFERMTDAAAQASAHKKKQSLGKRAHGAALSEHKTRTTSSPAHGR